MKKKNTKNTPAPVIRRVWRKEQWKRKQRMMEARRMEARLNWRVRVLSVKEEEDEDPVK